MERSTFGEILMPLGEPFEPQRDVFKELIGGICILLCIIGGMVWNPVCYLVMSFCVWAVVD